MCLCSFPYTVYSKVYKKVYHKETFGHIGGNKLCGEEGGRTHLPTHSWSALQEEAHCAEQRSMEGSGRVRRGKAETSRRLFSASLSPPLSRDPNGQRFAPGHNLSAQGVNTVHLQQHVLSVQKRCKKKKNYHQTMLKSYLKTLLMPKYAVSECTVISLPVISFISLHYYLSGFMDFCSSLYVRM